MMTSRILDVPPEMLAARHKTATGGAPIPEIELFATRTELPQYRPRRRMRTWRVRRLLSHTLRR